LQKAPNLLVNDNPYSFVLNDNPKDMQVKGAMDVALVKSLSKTFIMAG
jgi:hypothetical protein